MYAFIDSRSEVKKEDTTRLMVDYGLSDPLADKVFDLLLWYGFLGIKRGVEDTKYIYDFNYNMKLLMGVVKKASNEALYEIHPAFWPALMITGK